MIIWIDIDTLFVFFKNRCGQ